MLCIIAGIYVPPPFSSEVLKCMASFIARFPDVPLLAVGEFNNYLDPAWDKLPAPTLSSSVIRGPTPFARLLGELGLMAVWRLRHPGIKKFSCYLATYGGLSRIDLGLGNHTLLPLLI